MMDKTIVYLTDNEFDPKLADVCMKWLVRNRCDCPIVSVSKRPIEFGENVCVGPLPRTGMSIDIALHEGMKRVRTKWVMVAEHDCLYSKEHVRWIPPDDVCFYYNDNNWLLQCENPTYPQYDGMFSHRRHRMVQSQLVCSSEKLLEAMSMKIEITADPAWSELYPSGRVAEPGCCNISRTMRLARNDKVKHLGGKVARYMSAYEGKEFVTKEPNIDIRHNGNFTGQRRGNYRRFNLEPWGTMSDILAI